VVGTRFVCALHIPEHCTLSARNSVLFAVQILHVPLEYHSALSHTLIVLEEKHAMHCKHFSINVFPKNGLAKPQFYYQLNICKKQNYNVLSGIMVLWREVRNYRCSHSAISVRNNIISKRSYEITVVQDIHMSKSELKRWPLEPI
jgi:hypothetical protein